MQYLSEIRIFSFDYAPRGWVQCNGQQFRISMYSALYSLLGNTFGGDSQNFNIPDFRGRVPMNWGSYFNNLNYVWGQNGGEIQHTLTVGEMPAHIHLATGSSSPADIETPGGANWASNTGFQVYGSNPVLAMSADALFTSGLGVPHANMSPFLALNVCMSMTGIYPSKP